MDQNEFLVSPFIHICILKDQLALQPFEFHLDNLNFSLFFAQNQMNFINHSMKNGHHKVCYLCPRQLMVLNVKINFNCLPSGQMEV